MDQINDMDVSLMRQKVLDAVGGILDSRLATQYALTVMCAEKVNLKLITKKVSPLHERTSL